MWLPKGAVLITGQPLFEAQHLLEEIRYRPSPIPLSADPSGFVISKSKVYNKL